ncbi:hypothetical protein [Haloferula sp. A504]|uniref:hypothetical protein n=1 Tax=Haloferula sp. A504 TaxID=3373601 RepID=UPI0031C64FD4|nr:hypothetical protein [Verrucomicrobiaceae bacterium E54]
MKQNTIGDGKVVSTKKVAKGPKPQADRVKKETVAALAGHEEDEKKARELIGEINASESEVEKLHRKLVAKQHASFEKALDLGEIFCRLKEACGHGRWEAYVEKHLGCSSKKASMYMRFHTHRGDLEKSETFPKLSIREANGLLKKPKKPVAAKTAATDKTAEEEAVDSGSESEPGDGLELADGKSLSLTNANWSEGLISRGELEHLIQQAAPRKNRPASRIVAAREQRLIVAIVAGVNRECDGTQHDQAVARVRSALDKILGLLSPVGADEAA